MQRFDSSPTTGDVPAGTSRREDVPAGTPRADRPVSPNAWWPPALALMAVGWGANQFTPMLLLYRADFGVATTQVQLAFAAYVFALVPGLLAGGPVSDRIGRRPVVLIGVACSLLSGLVLAGAGIADRPALVGVLIAGRLLQGFAAGAAFSAGAAWVAELSALAGDAAAAPRRSTIAMTAGFALGPLVAGLCAQWAPLPQVTAYLPHLVLCCAAILALVRMRVPARLGPVAPGATRPRRRVLSPHLRHRRFLLVIAPLAPWVFAAPSVSFGYLPGVIMDRLGDLALAWTAMLTAVVGVAGVAVQSVARRLAPRALLAVALGLATVGMLLGGGAAGLGSPGAVLVAGVVLGAAYGCCQVAGLGEVQRLAEPAHLASTTAAFQALSYLGLTAPLWLALAEAIAPPPVLLVVVAGLAALTMLIVLAAARQPASPEREPEAAP
ncbi:MFS family permease [Naumannella cuiyingiana]|uniref:MFS family permease n=1 Tax=Naumannella cuiyingiana TaxID=1347891 RepID=A0A7Z0D730_9ACTN|nr:MFS family permease [Naumannella cuiyingiana]